MLQIFTCGDNVTTQDIHLTQVLTKSPSTTAGLLQIRQAEVYGTMTEQQEILSNDSFLGRGMA